MGRRAPELPSGFPLPPGAAVLGAATGTYSRTVIDVPAPSIEVLAFYRAALPRLGWDIVLGSAAGASDGSGDLTACRSGQRVWVSSVSVPAGTALTLGVAPGDGICLVPNTRPLVPTPLLSPPAGVGYFVENGNLDQQYAYNQVLATSMSIRALNDWYAQQLRTLRWTRLGGELSARHGWQLWSRTYGTDRLAVVTVTVTAVSAGTRQLTVHVSDTEAGVTGATTTRPASNAPTTQASR